MKKKNLRSRIAGVLVAVLLLAGALYLHTTTDHFWIRASTVKVAVNGQTLPVQVFRSSGGALLINLENSDNGFFIVDYNSTIKRTDVRETNRPDFYLLGAVALCKNSQEGGKQLGPISSDYPPAYIETPQSIEFTSSRNDRIKVVW